MNNNQIENALAELAAKLAEIRLISQENIIKIIADDCLDKIKELNNSL